MTKCKYCDADVFEGSGIVVDGKAFCNALHRYSWEADRVADVTSPSGLHNNDTITGSIGNRSSKVLSAILEATTSFERPSSEGEQTNQSRKSIGAGTRVILFSITLVIVGAMVAVELSDNDLEPSENIIYRDSRESNLISQAQEMVNATLRGDYDKLADFTFHRLVQACGGRDNMVAALKKGTEEMERSGCRIVSYELASIKEVREIEHELIAVVPATLRLHTPKGILKKQSFMLAISTDDGERWTFMDGSVLSKESAIKALLPEAMGKITIPEIKEPIMLPN